jgi:diguanylate cyclase (GGDEF)-like protein
MTRGKDMSAARTIRTLLIEDSDDDAQLLVRTIRRGGFEPVILRVDTPEDLAKAMQQQWDIVLSDYSMPRLNGVEALQLVRKYEPDIPFFYVSGTLGEDRAVAAMRSGAQDYFIKGNLKRLTSAIERELADSIRRREYRLAQERIHHLANYDTLTGLPNRLLFTELCTRYLAEAQQSQRGLAMFCMDLDNFKSVNDQLGSNAGDALLVQLSQRLCALVNPEGVVARSSVDEFRILMPGLDNELQAVGMADKLLALLSRPFSLLRYDWRISASMGGSLFPLHGRDCDTLQASAVMALHHAQKIPGNSYLSYTGTMKKMVQDKLQMNHALEQALEYGEFKLHYQPQVHTGSGRIAGAEALIRWQRVDHQMMGPDEFIPLAEESGLIVAIGDWVMHEACMQAKRWRDYQLPPMRLAINFSAYQFRQRNLVKTVVSQLDEYQLSPDCLEIEITETTLMQDADAAQIVLFDLHERGIHIALDDFGTGYSSLSHLKRFPVDVLKIDKSFVNDLPHDKDNAAIVHAIIAMASKLGIQVVAEGVETIEQFDFLKEAGCDIVQGYFIQHPISGEDILPMLQRGNY